MLAQLQSALAGVTLGFTEQLKQKLAPILVNRAIFGVDLAPVGLSDKIAGMVAEELAGPGAVRKTLRKYLANAE
jgi:fructuronate reductase